MHVTIEHVEYNSNDAMNFVSKFNELEVVEVKVEALFRTTGTKYWSIQIKLDAEDIDNIECEDHIYRAGDEYPKDLLITCHKHD